MYTFYLTIQILLVYTDDVDLGSFYHVTFEKTPFIRLNNLIEKYYTNETEEIMKSMEIRYQQHNYNLSLGTSKGHGMIELLTILLETIFNESIFEYFGEKYKISNLIIKISLVNEVEEILSNGFNNGKMKVSDLIDLIRIKRNQEYQEIVINEYKDEKINLLINEFSKFIFTIEDENYKFIYNKNFSRHRLFLADFLETRAVNLEILFWEDCAENIFESLEMFFQRFEYGNGQKETRVFLDLDTNILLLKELFILIDNKNQGFCFTKLELFINKLQLVITSKIKKIHINKSLHAVTKCPNIYFHIQQYTISETIWSLFLFEIKKTVPDTPFTIFRVYIIREQLIELQNNIFKYINILIDSNAYINPPCINLVVNIIEQSTA